MKKVRIGMVGMGNIACAHLNAYKKVAGAEIVCACDINPVTLKKNCDAFGIPEDHRYASIQEMLENEKDLDAADVCVWNVSHAECSIYALERGLNVLCEKPMAYNVEQAEKMKEAADKAGKLLMIGFVLRFSNENAIASEFINAGILGDIYYSKATYLRRHGAPGGWFCDKSLSGGGPVIDLGVHVIDQTRLLMGSPKPVSVFASISSGIGTRPELVNKPGWVPDAAGRSFNCDVEDFGTALIRYDNGAVTLLETSYDLNGESVTKKELFGTKGGMSLGGEPKIYTVMNNYLTDITPIVPKKKDDMFENEMAHFVDCVANGTECRAKPEDGIWVMKILNAIYESAKTGHEVIIK